MTTAELEKQILEILDYQTPDFRNLNRISAQKIASLIEKQKPEDELFDMSAIPQEGKDKLIRGFSELTAKHALRLFLSLGLKTHFEVMIVNDSTGEEYVLSFKTLKKFIEQKPDCYPDTEADGYVFCGKCGKMK